MALFFPDVYDDIDWSKGIEPLEQELREITFNDESSKSVVDKLMKVCRKNGAEGLVFIHIEFQAQRDKKLPKRVFQYYCKMVSKQKTPLMSLVVLGDNQPGWRPQQYREDLWGCEIRLKFLTVKLLDYKDQMDELKKSGNLFVFFVAAHLRTLETTSNPQQRLHYKQVLTKELINQGMESVKAIDLIRFIDAIMSLPKELEDEFIEDIREYQEEIKMPFVAPIEQQAVEKGINQGIAIGEVKGSLEEARISLTEILEVVFGAVPESIHGVLQQLDDIEVVRRLRRQALKTASLDEFSRLLDDAVRSSR